MDQEASPAAESPRLDRLPFSPAAGCLLSILVGLLCASSFFAVLWLDRQGQIVFASEPFRMTRVWILRGAEGRGLGVSTTRPRPGATENDLCAFTEVRFYFVGGSIPGADTAYCECFMRGASGWLSRGVCQD